MTRPTPPSRFFDIDPPGAAAAAFGKDERQLATARQVNHAVKHVGHLFSATATGDRNALGQIGQDSLAQARRKVRSLGRIPRQPAEKETESPYRSQAEGNEHRVDERQVVGTNQDGAVVLAADAPERAPRFTNPSMR